MMPNDDIHLIKLTIEELELNDLYKEVIQSVLDNLKSSGLEYVEKLILFGSSARNEVKLGSDVDIMVITSYKLNDVKERTKVYGLNPLSQIEVDIVIYTKEELEQGNSKFTELVKKDGIIIWEKDA